MAEQSAREVIAASVASSSGETVWSGMSGGLQARYLRHADEALAALHSAGYVVERGWSSDMDAAPRDGTPILCKSEGEMGRRYDPKHEFVAWWAKGGFAGAGWAREVKSSPPNPNYACYPTAWRPRPASPAAETEG